MRIHAYDPTQRVITPKKMDVAEFFNNTNMLGQICVSDELMKCCIEKIPYVTFSSFQINQAFVEINPHEYNIGGFGDAFTKACRDGDFFKEQRHENIIRIMMYLRERAPFGESIPDFLEQPFYLRVIGIIQHNNNPEFIVGNYNSMDAGDFRWDFQLMSSNELKLFIMRQSRGGVSLLEIQDYV